MMTSLRSCWAAKGQVCTPLRSIPCAYWSAGSNFGRPHRDYSFAESNEAEGGELQTKLLSIWIPLSDTTVSMCLLLSHVAHSASTVAECCVAECCVLSAVSLSAVSLSAVSLSAVSRSSRTAACMCCRGLQIQSLRWTPRTRICWSPCAHHLAPTTLRRHRVLRMAAGATSGSSGTGATIPADASEASSMQGTQHTAAARNNRAGSALY